MQRYTDTLISQKQLPLTENIKLNRTEEKFVDIYEYSNGEIKVDMQYAKAGIPFAIKTAYVRETVAKKLMQAKGLLPQGYSFEIFDAWRPYEVQLGLFNAYRKRIVDNAKEVMTEQEITRRVCEFVSLPDKDKRVSFVHSTGGAVDVTIVRPDGSRLDMGTEFDDFSPRSYTAWYEGGGDEQIKRNRRLLHNVLCSCGFTNYPAEWWHYDFGDPFWAFYMKKEAIYSSEYEEAEVKGKG